MKKPKLNIVYLANVESEAENGCLDVGQNNIAIYNITTQVSRRVNGTLSISWLYVKRKRNKRVRCIDWPVRMN